MTKPIDVLVLEDSADDAELLIHELRRGGLAPTWRRIETEEAYLRALEEPPDVILSDYMIPGFGAMRALRLLCERSLDVPFIVVSGAIGEDQALEAIRQGATDYFMKDRLLRLAVAVENAVNMRRVHEERRAATEALREREEQLRQAQKMEAIGRLAGGVAHDFNNLLTIITGYGEILTKRLPSGDPLHADVEEIRRASSRAADLTRQLLVFSRRQIVQPRVLDLNELVGQIERMLGRLIGEDVVLTTSLTVEPITISADPSHVEQVVLNLAVNARDAMPTGGSLSIETSLVDLDAAEAAACSIAPGRYARLAVADTGVGMDDETQAHAFEPFFTTKEVGRGTGLGLSTVYGIVQQASGGIRLESCPGRGTTFTLYFPWVAEAVTPAPHATADVERLTGQETILLVEDDERVRLFAQRVLESFGYRVLEAPESESALLLCESYPGTIDLLLTDVVMPGMSGRLLAERAIVMRPGLRVVFMSGYTQDDVLRHGVRAASVAFVEKPFTPISLARKVREVLDLQNHASHADGSTH